MIAPLSPGISTPLLAMLPAFHKYLTNRFRAAFSGNPAHRYPH